MALKAIACNICLVVMWIGVILICGLYGYVFGELIPVLKDLPNDVIDGFYSVLKFDSLTDDSATVKSAADSALDLCGIDAGEDCDGSSFSGTFSGNASACNGTCDTSSQLETIQAAFDNSLTTIQDVANDEYFGTDDMAAAASQLNEISDAYESVVTNASCYIQGGQYCIIYDQADALTAEVDTVLAQIDDWTEGDVINLYDEYGDVWNVIHVLPYFLVIAMLFFTCFWAKDASGPCCHGSACGGFLFCQYASWCFLFFCITGVISAIGLSWTYYAKEEITVDELNGSPTLKDLVSHVEENYPEFWNTVLGDDRVETLEMLLGVSVVATIFAVILGSWACCVCACSPYGKKESMDEA